MGVVIALLALLVPQLALAAPGDATVTLTAPTVRQDGTALPASAIQGYQFYVGCNTTPITVGALRPGPSPVLVPSLFPVPGTYSVGFRTKTTTGATLGTMSNCFAMTIDPQQEAPPGPGAIINVTFECPAGYTAVSTGTNRWQCQLP